MSHALQLEKYILKILDNRERLNDVLGEFSWKLNYDRGRIIFLNTDGRELCSTNFQFIGSVNHLNNTWLWSWAATGSQMPVHLIEGITRVMNEAMEHDEALFMKSDEFSITDETFADRMSIISTGYIKYFTYLPCHYEGGCLYIAIDGLPATEMIVSDMIRLESIIRSGIDRFSINHKQALTSYLGYAYIQKGDSLTWHLPQGSITVLLDEQDRIAHIRTTPTSQDKLSPPFPNLYR
jgi:hypothetical protein